MFEIFKTRMKDKIEEEVNRLTREYSKINEDYHNKLKELYRPVDEINKKLDAHVSTQLNRNQLTQLLTSGTYEKKRKALEEELNRRNEEYDQKSPPIKEELEKQEKVFLEKLKEPKERLNQLSFCKKEEQLGIEKKEIKEYINTHIDSIHLNEIDKMAYSNNESDLSNLEDYILIYKTNDMIENNRLEKNGQIICSLNGEDISVQTGRNKLAVLIPLNGINKDQVRIESLNKIKISLPLELPTSTIILCSKTAINYLKPKNKQIQVIPYDGSNVEGYVNGFLKALGYHVETIINDGWEDKTQEEKALTNLTKLNYNLKEEDEPEII